MGSTSTLLATPLFGPLTLFTPVTLSTPLSDCYSMLLTGHLGRPTNCPDEVHFANDFCLGKAARCEEGRAATRKAPIKVDYKICLNMHYALMEPRRKQQ